MALEFIPDLFTQFIQLNNIIIIGFLFVLLFIGYKLFQIALKSIIVGVIASMIPIAALIMGFDIGIPATLGNILWFAVFGVMSYLVYATVNAGVKTVKLVMKPFGVLFRNKPKQKIIIKNKEDD